MGVIHIKIIKKKIADFLNKPFQYICCQCREYADKKTEQKQELPVAQMVVQPFCVFVETTFFGMYGTASHWRMIFTSLCAPSLMMVDAVKLVVSS